MDGIWRCTKVSWDEHHGDYWLSLTLEGNGGGVGASFGCAALYELMEHCRPAQVWKPQDLVGKLFQTWWKDGGIGDSHGGDVIYAIRIHPSYRESHDSKAEEWLKTGIYMTGKERREETHGYLIVTEQ